jgi:hypothetical protein
MDQEIQVGLENNIVETTVTHTLCLTLNDPSFAFSYHNNSVSIIISRDSSVS